VHNCRQSLNVLAVDCKRENECGILSITPIPSRNVSGHVVPFRVEDGLKRIGELLATRKAA